MNKMISFSRRLVPHSVGTFGKSRCNTDFDVVKSDDALLDYIYGADPVNGLPIGDLSTFMSDKANPEIKAFIQTQLLHESPSVGSSLPTDVTNAFKSLSDDDVAFFSRNTGESREEFADRIKLYFEKEKSLRKQEAKLKEMKRLIYGNKPNN